MANQKVGSIVKYVVTHQAATRTAAAYTSSAVTLATYKYPKYGRLICGGTIDGGGTIDAKITENGTTGSHADLSGAAITQLTATGTNTIEFEIPSGSTEIKVVLTQGVATEESFAVVELCDFSYAT